MTIAAADMDFTVFCIFDHPAAKVFEAVADPTQLSHHFAMGGARGRMQAGATVTWEFADFPGAFDVQVIEASFPNARLVFDWPDHHTAARTASPSPSTNSPRTAPASTWTETGWQPTPEGLQSAYGNVMGWSYMLAAMRVWLDHGIAMRPRHVSLTPQPMPKGSRRSSARRASARALRIEIAPQLTQ